MMDSEGPTVVVSAEVLAGCVAPSSTSLKRGTVRNSNPTGRDRDERRARSRTVGPLMRVVLAEKPSVARELASFLGAGERRDGYFEGHGYQVTWALGHLATLKQPEDYDPALKR